MDTPGGAHANRKQKSDIRRQKRSTMGGSDRARHRCPVVKRYSLRECYPIRRQRTEIRRQKLSPICGCDKVRLHYIDEKVFAAESLMRIENRSQISEIRGALTEVRVTERATAAQL